MHVCACVMCQCVGSNHMHVYRATRSVLTVLILRDGIVFTFSNWTQNFFESKPHLTYFFIQHCIIYKVFFKVYCSFVLLFLFTYRTQNNNCFSSNSIALRSRYWIYIYLDIIWNCDYVINLHWMVSRDLIYLYIL